MKYAIIGDIHGNLEALTNVIDDAKKQDISGFFCVGDIVGYGADPSACIKKVQELGCVSVAGNHDFAACGKTDISSFNEFARQAVEWTSKVLPKEEILFLASLPYTHSSDSFSLVHSSWYIPESWGYVFTKKDAYLNFECQPTRISFIGHSHVPGIFRLKNGMILYDNPANKKLDENIKYLVNVGSVGQPRDDNPLSSYVIFDEDLKKIEFKRVEYNIQKAQKKILSSGLPEILAIRLAWGR